MRFGDHIRLQAYILTLSLSNRVAWGHGGAPRRSWRGACSIQAQARIHSKTPFSQSLNALPLPPFYIRVYCGPFPRRARESSRSFHPVRPPRPPPARGGGSANAASRPAFTVCSTITTPLPFDNHTRCRWRSTSALRWRSCCRAPPLRIFRHRLAVAVRQALQ